MHRLRTCVAAGACLALWAPGGVLAQAADVRELLQNADDAAKAVHEVEYDGKFFGEGPEACVERVGRVEGHVKIKETPPGLFSRFFGGSQDSLFVEGVVQLGGYEEKLPFSIACDAKRVYRLEPSAKVFFEGELPQAQPMLRRALPLVMREFTLPTPFSDELNGESKLESPQTIGEVKCDVVYVIYAHGRGESRWYFGQEDSLPRRVDRVFTDKEKGLTWSVVTEVHNLNVHPKLSVSDFRLSPPKGWEIRGFEEQGGHLLPIGTTAPPFALKSVSGKSVSLPSLKGRVVLLYFWANYSGPARLAMPVVQRLHDEFKDRPVSVLGVYVWEKNDDPTAEMRERGYNYDVLLSGDKVAELYHLENIPAFYVISPDGKVLYASIGYQPGKEQEIAQVIKNAIPKPEKE